MHAKKTCQQQSSHRIRNRITHLSQLSDALNSQDVVVKTDNASPTAVDVQHTHEKHSQTNVDDGQANEHQHRRVETVLAPAIHADGIVGDINHLMVRKRKVL